MVTQEHAKLNERLPEPNSKIGTRPGREPGQAKVYAQYDAFRRTSAGLLDLSSIPRAPRISHLDLDLTLACNLRCTYCFKVKDNEHQDLQIARDAITWLIYASGPSKQISVALIGGEPMLRFKQLQELVPFSKRRAAQHGKHIHFSMTTNGTILTDEILAFFKKWSIGFHTSIDGHPDVQDRHRTTVGGKGTSAELEGNIPRILELQPSVCARATVMPDTAREMGASFDYFRRLGYSTIAFVPGAPEQWTTVQIQEFSAGFEIIGDKVIESFREGRPLNVKYIHEMCEARAEGRTSRPSPCGVGRGMMLVDINGDIWPCHRWNKQDKAWRVGSMYEEGSSEGKRKELLTRKEAPKCADCVARPMCASGCPAENLELTGDPWLRHDNACALEAAAARTGARVYDVLSAEANVHFREIYMRDVCGKGAQ